MSLAPGAVPALPRGEPSGVPYSSAAEPVAALPKATEVRPVGPVDPSPLFDRPKLSAKLF